MRSEQINSAGARDNQTVTLERGRLADAAAVAFEALLRQGFDLVSSGTAGRGESCDLVSPHLLIALSVDWVEGELEVMLQSPGHPAVPLGSVIDLSLVRGLHLSRLPRGVSRGELVSTLSKIADALQRQAPDVLAGTPAGLARLEGST